MHAEHSAIRRLFVEAGLLTTGQRRAFVRQVVGRQDVEPVGRTALSGGECRLLLVALHHRVNAAVPDTGPPCPWCGEQPCPKEFEHAQAHRASETTWRST